MEVTSIATEEYKYVLLILRRGLRVDVEYYSEIPDIRFDIISTSDSIELDSMNILGWALCECVYDAWTIIDSYTVDPKHYNILLEYISNKLNGEI